MGRTVVRTVSSRTWGFLGRKEVTTVIGENEGGSGQMSGPRVDEPGGGRSWVGDSLVMRSVPPRARRA